MYVHLNGYLCIYSFSNECVEGHSLFMQGLQFFSIDIFFYRVHILFSSLPVPLHHLAVSFCHIVHLLYTTDNAPPTPLWSLRGRLHTLLVHAVLERLSLKLLLSDTD